MLARRRLVHRSTGARSSASPASRATGRPSCSRRSSGSEPLDAGTVELEGSDLPGVGTQGAPGAGDRLHPAGPPARRPGADGAAVGERHARPPDPAHPSPRALDRPRRGASTRTKEIIDEFDVRTPGPDVAALALSGGNQQKLIVGREMTAEPKVLIAAHPTRGIDVGAQAEIWDDLREARAAGLAVLLVSADLEELIGLSDTLVVFLPRPPGGHARPGDGHAGRARLVHDRSPATSRARHEAQAHLRPRRPGARHRRRRRRCRRIALLAIGESPVDRVPGHVHRDRLGRARWSTSSTAPLRTT